MMEDKKTLKMITPKFTHLGLFSSRNVLRVLNDPECFYIMIGNSIRKWRVSDCIFDFERTIPTLGDAPSYMWQNGRYLMCGSYFGVFTIFEKDGNGDISEDKCFRIENEGLKMRYTSLEGHVVAGCIELTPPLNSGKLVVWDLQSFKKDANSLPLMSKRGDFLCPILLSNSHIFCIEKHIIDQDLLSKNDKQNDKNDDNSNKRSRKGPKIHEYTKLLLNYRTGDILIKEKIGKLGDFITYSKDDITGQFCLAFITGEIYVYDGKTANLILTIKLHKIGSILSLNLEGSKFIFSMSPGILSVVDVSKLVYEEGIIILEMEDPESRKEGVAIYNVSEEALHPGTSILKWVDYERKILLSGDEDGLFKLNLLESADIQERRMAQLASCGVSLNKDGSYVAVGDLMGFVRVNSVATCSVATQFQYEIYTGQGVRSLCFLEKWSVLVGGFGGQLGLLKFNLQEGVLEDQKKVEFVILREGESEKLEGQITTIRVFEAPENSSILQNPELQVEDKNSTKLFMCSTTSGRVYIFKYEVVKNSVELLSQYMYHLPGESSSQFGSLHLKAEIWSCAFDPETPSKIATVSEDQEVKIWEILNHSPLKNVPEPDKGNHFVLKHTLQKHNLAVTCVDWQIMDPKLGKILAVCSDDKMVRVYKGDDLQKVAELDLTYITEFFTLTYLSLEKGGIKLLVAAQIGFIFLFDILSEKVIYKGRLHLGGVEGASYEAGIFATVSSNNCVVLTTFQ